MKSAKEMAISATTTAIKWMFGMAVLTVVFGQLYGLVPDITFWDIAQVSLVAGVVGFFFELCGKFFIGILFPYLFLAMIVSKGGYASKEDLFEDIKKRIDSLPVFQPKGLGQ